MNEELIKSLLKTKLKIIDCAADLLPSSTKVHVNNLKHSFLKAINEVTKEYMENPPDKKVKKDIVNISID